MDAIISLYSAQDTPRFRWASKVLFTSAMRVKVIHYSDLEAFSSAEGIKINYSPTPIEDSVHISPQGLLWEKELVDQEFYCTTWEELPIFCQRSMGDLPFDPLAAAFFLASRYEEYLPFIADQHGRFPASESFASHHGFLERPLINEWALKIGKLWIGAQFELKQYYTYTSSVDIDNLFAYKGKGALRTMGAIAGDITQLDFKRLRARLMALLGVQRDPFDTFRKQRNWNKKHQISMLYFMLFAEFGRNDRNVSPYSTEAAIKLREISDWSEVGIHPSYASDSQDMLVSKELNNLQEVLRQPVRQSRQHYLKMRMPHTFRTLLDLGITHDHSMGYAEVAGFRASLVTPFTFYDLELEAELPLVIHPFVFMDTTYYMYQKKGPKESLEQMKNWPEKVKEVGGELITVWHNRTFGEIEPDTQGWVQVYKEFIDAAQV